VVRDGPVLPVLDGDWVTLAVISMELWVFQWVINRMPILGAHPDFKSEEQTLDNLDDGEVVRWKGSVS